MIDWIGKLPDAALGAIAVGAAWFGFNYTVLGERLMMRELTALALPACIEQLAAKERSSMLPRSGIGELFGMPELDALEDRILDRVTPATLTQLQKEALCACAVSASADGNRFDYALHTATFRIIPVDELSLMRAGLVQLATSDQCAT